MSQILRGILIAAYIALFIHFLKILRTGPNTEIEMEYIIRPPGSLKKIMKELRNANKNNKDKNYQYTIVDRTFEKPVRLPTDLRYVLKWTKAMTHYSNPDFVNGQRPFLDKNCSFYNCYMTNDKSLLTDLRYFDAILFDVENDWDYHPYIRALHQKYIFTASEPASMYPLCDPLYNSYYNLTWSYKLDSTIPQTFFNVYFKNGTLAGPRIDMDWLDDTTYVAYDTKSKLKKKHKLAAWFVSHCKTKGKREQLVEDISKYLELYNYTIDVYGWCGKLSCPKDDLNTCLEMLRDDYYFYFAFENAVDVDYVTEKLLHALNYYTVPVVYGGADYSRFLPPNSYIDASTMSPGALASMLVELSGDPDAYAQYFTWHENYYYKPNSLGSNLCQLCELLNAPPETTELHNFTNWWNSQGECQKGEKGEFLTDIKHDF